MSTTTEIANLAISHLGNGKEIGNLETENSQEANAIRRFYETSRDEMLRLFDWPFATKFVALSLIEEDPTDEWGFSYQYPSDCLKFRRILGAGRNPINKNRLIYRTAYGTAGQIVLTDIEDAEAEYTMGVTDTSRFTPDFVMALSYRLAAYVAARITKGDPFQMTKSIQQLYYTSLSIAQANAMNEQQPDSYPDSEFISERNT